MWPALIAAKLRPVKKSIPMLADRITLSVVSHGQAALVYALLRDLERCDAKLEIVLTLNVDEVLPFDPAGFRHPVHVLRNPAPRGFGANHNAAFLHARGRWFCVVNPDIRINENPFPALLSTLEQRRVGVVAPAIFSPGGRIEDSARRFPTWRILLAKALTRRHTIDYTIDAAPLSPDWVAGMFMLFRHQTFAETGGFDERYFLYYEDVDLCRRLRRAGYDVMLVPEGKVVHDAQRASHRNLRYLRWHLCSLARYLLLPARRTGSLGDSSRRT